MILRPDGSLYSWGRKPALTLIQENVVVSSQASISAIFSHGLAVRADGTVAAWGDNNTGACNVPADLTNALAVAGGNGCSFAVRSDGTVTAWGNVWNGRGFVPVNVPPDLTNVIAISVGSSQALVLKSDGTVFAWSPAWDGVSPLTNSAPAGLTNVIAISAGGTHCLALIGDAPPQMQAAVTALQHSGSAVTLQLPTQSGRIYRLEYDSSLTGTNWSPSGIVPGNGSLQNLTDTSATNASRFYRVRRW